MSVRNHSPGRRPGRGLRRPSARASGRVLVGTIAVAAPATLLAAGLAAAAKTTKVKDPRGDDDSKAVPYCDIVKATSENASGRFVVHTVKLAAPPHPERFEGGAAVAINTKGGKRSEPEYYVNADEGVLAVDVSKGKKVKYSQRGAKLSFKFRLGAIGGPRKYGWYAISANCGDAADWAPGSQRTGRRVYAIHKAGRG